jgi:hypothetical protein
MTAYRPATTFRRQVCEHRLHQCIAQAALWHHAMVEQTVPSDLWICRGRVRDFDQLLKSLRSMIIVRN